jgi:hypothetical protein
MLHLYTRFTGVGQTSGAPEIRKDVAPGKNRHHSASGHNRYDRKPRESCLDLELGSFGAFSTFDSAAIGFVRAFFDFRFCGNWVRSAHSRHSIPRQLGSFGAFFDVSCLRAFGSFVVPSRPRSSFFVPLSFPCRFVRHILATRSGGRFVRCILATRSGGHWVRSRNFDSRSGGRWVRSRNFGCSPRRRPDRLPAPSLIQAHTSIPPFLSSFSMQITVGFVRAISAARQAHGPTAAGAIVDSNLAATMLVSFVSFDAN